ncbi:MAG TPA: helix-turn-helix transcriptional regulator [Candidatus Methanoperedenaceae archaeon]|nr:helix-turn-helix transcriptional regulator [Candidatus Methanoperedenaceae archaeon]
MAEPAKDEKLLILPLGDDSKKITQVISNDMAREILELLADTPLSASDIAERLGAPLTTVKYNIDNLESVGLVRVDTVKWSEKGREVKLYAPVRKLIVVVPEKMERSKITELLKKYLGIIVAAVFASGIIELFTRQAQSPMQSAMMKSAPPGFTNTGAIPGGYGYNYAGEAFNESAKIAGSAAQQAMAPAADAVNRTLNQTALYMGSNETVRTAIDQGAGPAAVTISGAQPDIGIWFLFGSLFVIALVMLIEYRKKR